MATPFQLQIFTQEKKVFEGAVTSITVPGEEGYIGVLAHHAPLVTTLGKGKLKVVSATAEAQYQVSGGFLEVHDNVATLLVDNLVEI